MEQRVSIMEGKKPLLLVATSGANDSNTDVLTEVVASKLNSYAVINWGWERSAKIDYLGGKADCNNIDHCRGLVYDEFLEPIIRLKNRINNLKFFHSLQKRWMIVFQIFNGFS